jgi:tetratricopeptide (TPR) repeat protein
MRRLSASVVAVLLGASLGASPAQCDELKDLHFGEALYYAHQSDYFSALERLDSEVIQHAELDQPELGTLQYHINDAEFSLGDFELRYRMHHRAGRAITAVLEGAVDERVRNDAAYRLARIHFQKNQIDDAMRALNRIDGEVPKPIRDDVEFLRANIYLAQDKPEEAMKAFERLQDSDSYGGFAAYNLGIAYLQDGQRSLALEQLDRAGQITTDDPAELAIRDKSNLVAGTIYLESGEQERALPYLNRVRLDGPFSNQALLSAGWASMATEQFDRAVVPWSILVEREVTDRATQEAMLALPYAYGKLDIHGRAAVYYGRALDAFGAEVDKLNKSIDSIREGKFLEALIREEIRKSEDWVIRLRSLPETPETYYMMELLASHDFQTGLQNYLDLADLRRKLLALDSKLRLRREQHMMLVKRRDDLLTTPRPEFLATPEEQAILKRIEYIESQMANADIAFSDTARLKRLKGRLTWTLETEYHARLTEFDRNLRSLDEAMAVAQAEYDQYVRSRQAATHSYVGYEAPIERLRTKARESVSKVELLMARQGRSLEVVAIEELMARRSHLENYGDKARFALADSYDRATQAQAKVNGE